MTAQHFNRHYRPKRQPYHRSGNPYFRSRSADHLPTSRLSATTARWSFKTWMRLLGGTIILIGIIWLTLFSPVFIIKDIKVSGAEAGKIDMIKELAWKQTKSHRWFIIPQSRLLTLSKKQLQAEIAQEYIFESIQIKKKLFHTLEIKIIEKKPAAVWFENESYYVVDQTGLVLAKENSPRSELAVLYNNSAPTIIAKQINTDKQVALTRGIELFKLTQTQFAYLKPKQISVPAERETIVLILDGGQLIYLTTKQSAQPQLEKLDTLLKTELKNRLPSVDYIDLRFGDKIYYK